jgi:hypothetical protein
VAFKAVTDTTSVNRIGHEGFVNDHKAPLV